MGRRAPPTPWCIHTVYQARTDFTWRMRGSGGAWWVLRWTKQITTRIAIMNYDFFVQRSPHAFRLWFFPRKIFDLTARVALIFIHSFIWIYISTSIHYIERRHHPNVIIMNCSCMPVYIEWTISAANHWMCCVLRCEICVTRNRHHCRFCIAFQHELYVSSVLFTLRLLATFGTR